jgi:hypothetical protein
MAKLSLSKKSSKLNLTRRHAEIFQEMILIGNHMSDFIASLEKKISAPKSSIQLARKWKFLMVRLAKLLI